MCIVSEKIDFNWKKKVADLIEKFFSSQFSDFLCFSVLCVSDFISSQSHMKYLFNLPICCACKKKRWKFDVHIVQCTTTTTTYQSTTSAARWGKKVSILFDFSSIHTRSSTTRCFNLLAQPACKHGNFIGNKWRDVWHEHRLRHSRKVLDILSASSQSSIIKCRCCACHRQLIEGKNILIEKTCCWKYENNVVWWCLRSLMLVCHFSLLDWFFPYHFSLFPSWKKMSNIASSSSSRHCSVNISQEFTTKIMRPSHIWWWCWCDAEYKKSCSFIRIKCSCIENQTITRCLLESFFSPWDSLFCCCHSDMLLLLFYVHSSAFKFHAVEVLNFPLETHHCRRRTHGARKALKFRYRSSSIVILKWELKLDTFILKLDFLLCYCCSSPAIANKLSSHHDIKAPTHNSPFNPNKRMENCCVECREARE